VKIVNKYGLHARPAMQLVELANTYSSKIEISSNRLTVDAKSIMSVMRLAAAEGTVLKITADGSDAAAAVTTLSELIEDGFGTVERQIEEQTDAAAAQQ